MDSFTVSYGDPQTVAVWAKRALKAKTDVLLDQRRKGREDDRLASGQAASDTASRTSTTTPSPGRGDRASPGDSVEVWFTGTRPARTCRRARSRDRSRASTSPTPLAQDTGSSVLIVANEDYTGVNPTLRRRMPARSTSTSTSPPWRPTASPRMSGMSMRRACRTTWASSATTTPSLWYLGDNRLTQDPEDEFIHSSALSTPISRSPNASST